MRLSKNLYALLEVNHETGEENLVGLYSNGQHLPCVSTNKEALERSMKNIIPTIDGNSIILATYIRES